MSLKFGIEKNEVFICALYIYRINLNIRCVQIFCQFNVVRKCISQRLRKLDFQPLSRLWEHQVQFSLMMCCRAYCG